MNLFCQLRRMSSDNQNRKNVRLKRAIIESTSRVYREIIEVHHPSTCTENGESQFFWIKIKKCLCLICGVSKSQNFVEKGCVGRGESLHNRNNCCTFAPAFVRSA